MSITMSIYTGSHVLPSPVSMEMTMDPMTSDYQGLNGVVKRDRRVSSGSPVWRAVIKWDALTADESDAIEGIWLHLVKNLSQLGSLIMPNGKSYSFTISPKDRSFSREPFATGDGVDVFMATLVLRMIEDDI